MNRGDVVVVPFPFQDQPGEKIRPAVIVQCDSGAPSTLKWHWQSQCDTNQLSMPSVRGRLTPPKIA